jgi:membrane peptidoglycan carboxypeptidase
MTEGVMPLEMALAYASFPAGGKLNTPICYYKVLDRDGELLLEGKSTQTEAMNEGVAWIMTDVLRSVVKANGYMYVEGVVPGGKTGTTNDQYDIWFDGFTQAYAASLWIGTDENVEMSSMSAPAAALWGRIITQLPKAKEGSYAPQPANVISKGGDYFTKGTETGLTSWSEKEAKEKAKKDAYNKWLKERENHKVKVIDEEGHYENIHHDAITHQEDDLSKPIYGTKKVDDPDKPIHGNPDDPDEITGYEQKTVTDYDNIVGYEKKTVVDKEAWDEKGKWIEERWHWEYEKGWRDGDFKYKG